MEVLHPRCAGLDVHRDSVVACARVVDHGRVEHLAETFGTTTSELERLSRWLAGHGITHAAMEATGVGWAWHAARPLTRAGPSGATSPGAQGSTAVREGLRVRPGRATRWAHRPPAPERQARRRLHTPNGSWVAAATSAAAATLPHRRGHREGTG